MEHLKTIKRIVWTALIALGMLPNALGQCQDISMFYISQLEGCEDSRIVVEAVVTEGAFAEWTVIKGSENSIIDPFSKITEVTPESTTVYRAEVKGSGDAELLKNGDFDEGFTEFTTDFIYTDTVNTQGVFTIATSSVDSSFVHKKDHTSGTGNMFIADGSKFSEKAIYKIEETLEKGGAYTFSFWMANNHKDFLLDSVTDSRISVEPTLHINGEMVYSQLLPDDTSWTKVTYSWTEETGGTKTIEIKNLTTTKKGNDFVLDDVSLMHSCIQTQEITIEPCNKDDVFSPNNDGWKDTYYVAEDGIAKIYDLTGAEVGQFTAPNYWDGTDKYGNPLQGGYYVIIVNENTVHRITIVR